MEDSGKEYLDMDSILINSYLGDSGEEYLDMDAYMGPQEYSMCQPVYDSEEYSHSEVIHFLCFLGLINIFIFIWKGYFKGIEETGHLPQTLIL